VCLFVCLYDNGILSGAKNRGVKLCMRVRLLSRQVFSNFSELWLAWSHGGVITSRMSYIEIAEGPSELGAVAWWAVGIGTAPSHKVVWWDLRLASLLTHLFKRCLKRHLMQPNATQCHYDDTNVFYVCCLSNFLWPPYVIGQAIYIFMMWFLLSFFFFPRLISARSETGCLPYFHTWCGLSVNLQCRSATCCARLAENTARKKSPKSRHLGTIPQLYWAMSSQLRHVSTIGKKLVKHQYLPHMSPTI